MKLRYVDLSRGLDLLDYCWRALESENCFHKVLENTWFNHYR